MKRLVLVAMALSGCVTARVGGRVYKPWEVEYPITLSDGRGGTLVIGVGTDGMWTVRPSDGTYVRLFVQGPVCTPPAPPGNPPAPSAAPVKAPPTVLPSNKAGGAGKP